MVDTKNKESAEFNWKPGDVIVFRTNMMHRWDNGDKCTVMIGIETVPLFLILAETTSNDANINREEMPPSIMYFRIR